MERPTRLCLCKLALNMGKIGTMCGDRESIPPGHRSDSAKGFAVHANVESYDREGSVMVDLDLA